MILSDDTIFRRCADARVPMIWPFSDRTVENGMTYGLGPCGYDVRVEFDPLGEIAEVEIPPGGFLLASTMERFSMPPDVVGKVHDKSSWARKGVTLQNTVIEPGWDGYLTLEITNHSHVAVAIPRGAPMAQIVFHLLDAPARKPYDGKYSNQGRGPQESR